MECAARARDGMRGFITARGGGRGDREKGALADTGSR